MYLSTFMGPAALTPAQDRPLIDQCLELAERPPQAGFAMVTFGEQHFNNYEPYCNPLLMAARLSGVLGETWFGTTIVPLPLHSVVRLAEDSAVVDVLTRGRFLLGVSAGRGAVRSDYENWGVDADDRMAAFASKLDLLTRIYRHRQGDAPLEIDTRWDTGRVPGRLMPVPFRAGGPQLAVGTNTDETIDLVAAQGLALLLGPCLPGDAAAKLARHRVGMAAAGYDEARIEDAAAKSLVTRHVILGATEDEAWERAERLVGRNPMLDRSHDTRSLRELSQVPDDAIGADPHPRNVVHVKSWIIAGTPDQVVRTLLAYEAAGVRHVNLRFLVGVYQPVEVVRSFELMAGEVLPALKPRMFAPPSEAETDPVQLADPLALPTFEAHIGGLPPAAAHPMPTPTAI